MKASGRAAEIVVHPDPGAAARDAAGRFAEIAEKAVRDRGRFCVALSGGSTPQSLHRLLAEPPFRDRTDWARVHLFFGDERCVPPDHPDSNYRAVYENLISRVPIPAVQVHRMPADRQDLAKAAAEYEAEIREVLGDGAVFDLILLGLGEDGHTASLFPGSPALGEAKRLVAENYSDRLKSRRMTFTFPLINRAARVLFLVEGRAKAEAVRRAVEDAGGPVPAGRVRPEAGGLTWIMDRAAASRLDLS